MANKYQMIREKMARYNQWEIEELRSLSPEERIKRFQILYHAKNDLPGETVKRAMKAHLDNLIDIRKRLRQAR